jgi:hypothetical protein
LDGVRLPRALPGATCACDESRLYSSLASDRFAPKDLGGTG